MVRKRRDQVNENQPTMHDVARVAGVSQMTVSRVMRGSGYSSKNVRDQVHKAAREIGYVHNRLAAGIAAYDNPLVGVILPTLQNRVFTEVLTGISETLGQYGLRPVFGVSEYDTQAEEDLVFDLLSWRPRGMILPGLEHTRSVHEIIERTGVRVAEIMDVDAEPISACFGISHQRAGAEMAQHLLDRGYRRFCYIASQGGQDLRASKRFDAFAKRIAEAEGQLLAHETADGASSMLLGRRMTAEMLDRTPPPDAIYYANDDLAAGGLMEALARGLEVPGDLAIAGFNGLEFLEALPMRITSTETPRYDIGKAAADWIFGTENPLIENGRLELEAKLVQGDTT